VTDTPLCVGIDIGTARSAVAVWQDDRAVVVPNAEGQVHTPSVVTFDAAGEPIVGSRAIDLAILHPERSFHGFKHLFGLAGRSVAVDGRHWSPEDLAVLILEKLKADAEAHLGEPVPIAVLTAPVAFALHQRDVLKRAAERAGIQVLRIMDEPVAAALVLHHRTKEAKDETYFVFDLGGGTLDISIIEIGDGVYEVRSVAGDTHLGGADWDVRIANAVCEGFEETTGLTVSADPVAWQRVLLAAERAKVDLTSTPRASMTVPHLARDGRGSHHLEAEVTRTEVAAWTADLLDRCRRLGEQAATDATWDPRPNRSRPLGPMRPLLVGGGSRLFCMPALVEGLAGGPVAGGIDPEQAVVAGAALEAAVLRGQVKDTLVLPVVPTTLAVRWGPATQELIRRNSTHPIRRTELMLTRTAQVDQLLFLTEGDPEVGQALDVVAVADPRALHPDLAAGDGVEVIIDVDANGRVDWEVRSPETELRMRATVGSETTAAARRAWRERRPLEEPARNGHPPPQSGGHRTAGGGHRTATDRADGPCGGERGAATGPGSEPGPGILGHSGGTRRAFVSYSRQDRTYVERLVGHLRSHAVPAWWDEDVEIGEQSILRLADELRSSGAVVLVMSPESDRSTWVAREVAAAQRAGTTILPLLLGGSPMFQVAELQYEDVTGGALPSDRFVERARALCGVR
jgi:molecular chaperone DnaK